MPHFQYLIFNITCYSSKIRHFHEKKSSKWRRFICRNFALTIFSWKQIFFCNYWIILTKFFTLQCFHEKLPILASKNTTFNSYSKPYDNSALHTDLGRNFECGYSTVRKFSNFPATLKLREINFGWFQRDKKLLLSQFWMLCILTLEKFQNWKYPKFPEIQNSELVKGQFLGLQNDQNWFHVKSEWQKIPGIFNCVFPIRLPRSVFSNRYLNFAREKKKRINT